MLCLSHMKSTEWIEPEGSIDNIPKVLEPIIESTIEICKNSFGDTLYAVYVHGSAARGDWQFGKSDIDTVVFVTSRPNDSSNESYKKLIGELSDTQSLVPYIDAHAIVMPELHDTKNIGSIITLQACGVCVWGKAINLTTYLPNKTAAIAAYVANMKKRVKDSISSQRNSANPPLLSRRLAKFGIRTLVYGAVSNGAKLKTSLDDQIDLIEEYLPESSALAHELLQITQDDGAQVSRSAKLLEIAIQHCEKTTN